MFNTVILPNDFRTFLFPNNEVIRSVGLKSHDFSPILNLLLHLLFVHFYVRYISAFLVQQHCFAYEHAGNISDAISIYKEMRQMT